MIWNIILVLYTLYEFLKRFIQLSAHYSLKNLLLVIILFFLLLTPYPLYQTVLAAYLVQSLYLLALKR